MEEDNMSVYLKGVYDERDKWRNKIKCRLHDTNNWLDSGRYANYGLNPYELKAVKEELEKLLEDEEV